MTWNNFFNQEREKDYFRSLLCFIDNEYKNGVVYPKKENIFKAFELTPLNEVKVVIFGQDPYHEEGQAMGLSFSVPDNIDIPPSLKNIFKEIEEEYNTISLNQSGDLTYLAKQGVLLLNTILTVKEHKPLSHNIKEYKQLMINIVKLLNSLDQPMVFMLWGNQAKKYKEYLTNPKHLILEAVHPSPLGANKGGWFGCNHFKIANEFLCKNQIKIINWLNY